MPQRVLSICAMAAAMAWAAAMAAAMPSVAGETAPPTPTPGRLIALAPLEAPRLPPDLAAALPYLMEAALEGDLGWEVVLGSATPATSPAPGRPLVLEVAGSGPWKLSARIGAGPQGGKSARAAATIEIKTLTDLMQAAQEVAGSLDRKLRGDDAVAAPSLLAQSLSASAAAIGLYAQGRQMVRAGRVEEGLALLGRALQEDPGFTLAAAEILLTLYVAREPGKGRDAAVALATARPGGDAPLGAALREGLAALVRAEAPAALEAGRRLTEANPDLIWGRALTGMAQTLAKARPDAAASWVAAARLDPQDPRVELGSGLASLAAGDLVPAAAAFEAARKSWPRHLLAWTLQAEVQVRQRDVAAARATVSAMKSWMAEQGIAPQSDETYPDLMLGSLDLMEGHFREGMKYLETLLAGITQSGKTDVPTGTLRRTLVDMRRDLINSSDQITRAGQVADARRAIQVYTEWLGPRAQEPLHAGELLRMEGLVRIKEGNTAKAWETVELIKTAQAGQGGSAYDAACLSAMIYVREGDAMAALPMFQLAVTERGRIEDWMDLARTQFRARRLKEARASLDIIEEKIKAWDGADVSGLILPQPVVAMSLPVFYYTRASLAFDEGKSAESRRYFGMMLKYLREPDRELYLLAKEAIERGATPL